jgi:TonB family protein
MGQAKGDPMASRDSFRSANFVGLSLILHSTALVAIALGPTYFPSLMKNSDGQGLGSGQEQIEIQVSEAAPSATEIPVVQPELVKVQEQVNVAPAKQVVAKKASPKPVAAKLPEKVVVQEESPVEVVATKETDETEEIDPRYSALAEEPIVSEDLSHQAPAAQEVSTVEADTEQVQAEAVSGEGDGAKTVTVEQSFTELRQVPGNRPPQYTREMRLKKMEGKGQLIYYVNKDGQVSDIRLVESTGYPILDQEAMNAFKRYKFVPGQEGYTVHNFEFRLTGPSDSSNTAVGSNQQ